MSETIKLNSVDFFKQIEDLRNEKKEIIIKLKSHRDFYSTQSYRLDFNKTTRKYYSVKLETVEEFLTMLEEE